MSENPRAPNDFDSWLDYLYDRPRPEEAPPAPSADVPEDNAGAPAAPEPVTTRGAVPDPIPVSNLDAPADSHPSALGEGFDAAADERIDEVLTPAQREESESRAASLAGESGPHVAEPPAPPPSPDVFGPTAAGVAVAVAPSVPADRVMSGSATLRATGLVKVYRKRRVVNNVALHVSQGEIVGLLGPNGAGKTTTFYMMVGLIAPDEGRVSLDAEDLTNVPMYRRARKGVGYLSQEPSVFRKLTVEENILSILQMLGTSRREQAERLEVLLDELGLKHLRASKAYALSGGERRRLEITRALVGQPKFMLLDEPFAGVDPIAVHDIQQIVADLRHRNIGVLISDHNVEQTLDIVDRAYIMYEGGVRVSGTVSELVWNDEVAEIYLGPTLTARMRQRYSYPDRGNE